LLLGPPYHLQEHIELSVDRVTTLADTDSRGIQLLDVTPNFKRFNHSMFLFATSYGPPLMQWRWIVLGSTRALCSGLNLNWLVIAFCGVLPSGCAKTPEPAPIPSPSVIRQIVISVYDNLDTPDKVLAQSVVTDPDQIRELYECLTPNVISSWAEKAMKRPIVGTLEIEGPEGPILVEFIVTGKNRLCFRIGTHAYLRQAQPLEDMHSYYRRHYGVTTESLDEGYALYYKLKSLCGLPE